MTGTPEASKAWSITLLLAVFMMINFFDKIVLGLVAIPLMDELKLTPREFGEIGGSFFWLFTVSGIAGGFLANHFKTRFLILSMVVIWSLSQLPIVFSASIGTIVACRVMLGFGEGPAWPVAVHALYKWFPDDKRNLPVAILAQGSGIGLILSGIGIPLITAQWGWRANFLFLGIVGCIWAVIWLFVADEGQHEREDSTASASALSAIPYLRLLLDRTVLGCIITNFTGYWSLALGLTWLPAYFQRGLGYNGIESGWLYSLVVALTIPSGIGLAWWSQRLLLGGASSKVARGRYISCLLTFAGFLLAIIYILPPGDSARIVLIAIALACTPIVYSLSPAILAEVTPPAQRGAILAIVNSIASLAGIAAPFVTGAIIQGIPGALGFETGFALCGGLMMVGGIFGLCLIDSERSAQELHRGPIAPAPPTQATHGI